MSSRRSQQFNEGPFRKNTSTHHCSTRMQVLLFPKTQFNGSGGSLAYISLMPNSVVSASRSLWRSVYRIAAADMHRTPSAAANVGGCNC
jgi:hypothetical protein